MNEASKHKRIRIDIEQLVTSLTDKQYDVLVCLFFDVSAKSIGRALHISDRTVEGHLNAIFRKAQVNRKDELLKYIRLHVSDQVYDKFRSRFIELTEEDAFVSSIRTGFCKKWILYFFIMMSFIAGCLYLCCNKNDVTLTNVVTTSYILPRENLLSQLNKTTDGLDITILFAHGGAGKTALAREYQHRAVSGVTYEINAETFESLKNGLVGLAYMLAQTKEQQKNLSFLNGISDPNEQLRQISAFVFLNLQHVSGWCLLFDNVENFRLLRYNCFNMIPAQLGTTDGQILITTRNYSTAQYFPNAKRLEVCELSATEKEQLFEKITGQRLTNDTRDCLENIPSYPLDVSCCAYYIKNVHISLREYLQRMEQEGDSFWGSSKRITAENTGYSSTRKEIIATLIDRITNNNPCFQKMLFVMSLMDYRDIPINLLRKIYSNTLVDELLFNLTKYGVTQSSSTGYSFHRSTFAYMLEYFQRKLSLTEQKQAINQLVDAITPYDQLNDKANDCDNIISHVKCLATNIAQLACTDASIKIPLLVSIGMFIKERHILALESVPFLQASLDVNASVNLLSQSEKNKILLAAGEACVIANDNDRGQTYLQSCCFLEAGSTDEANKHILMGMIFMRKNRFHLANQEYEKAMQILNKLPYYSLKERLLLAKMYLNKGLNFCLFYINKPQQQEAIEFMKKAINSIENDIPEEEAIKIILAAKIRMAGCYNSMKHYTTALALVDEAENLLNQLKRRDNHYFCSLGLLLMERGHANLRLNRLIEAKDALHQAHILFDKTMIGDHELRVKMQEAETLVRLGLYDDAYKNCTEVFNKIGQENNDYNKLFACTAYYNAAVIKYKMKEYKQSLELFREFSRRMSVFCKHFLSSSEYLLLKNSHVFDDDVSSFPIYFQNALLIFKSVCLEGSEFISDYVQRNYEDVCCALESLKR